VVETALAREPRGRAGRLISIGYFFTEGPPFDSVSRRQPSTKYTTTITEDYLSERHFPPSSHISRQHEMAAFESSSTLLHANDNAQASSSTPKRPATPLVPDDESAISVHLPQRLLVLPPAAFALGAFVGLSRGGSRARLRFLAENAHRPPTTVQGWVRSFVGSVIL